MSFMGGLVMAVNKCGFTVLAKVPGGEGIDMRLSPSPLWNDYSVACFFLYNDKPAALLYRDRFFIDSKAAPLADPVFTLDPASASPVSSALTAFTPLAKGREIVGLGRGKDGFWYFHVEDSTGEKPRSSYYKIPDLNKNVSSTKDSSDIGFNAWSGALYPEDSLDAPPSLLPFLRILAGSSFGRNGTVSFCSDALGGARVFALGVGAGMESAGGGTITFGDAPGAADSPLLGAFRERDGLCLALHGDGTGKSYSPGGALKDYKLPPLPEGFVYTGVGFVGDAIAATWEERDDAAIGSAGFMLANVF
jgi:hypothetical protein